MKKTYITPSVKTTELQLQGIICVSGASGSGLHIGGAGGAAGGHAPRR